MLTHSVDKDPGWFSSLLLPQKRHRAALCFLLAGGGSYSECFILLGGAQMEFFL